MPRQSKICSDTLQCQVSARLLFVMAESHTSWAREHSCLLICMHTFLTIFVISILFTHKDKISDYECHMVCSL